METKIVLDTNVYISAFLFGGVPEKIIELAIESKVELFISAPILDELKEKLLEKFHYPEEEANKILNTILLIAQSVKAKGSLKNISTDPDDDIILETSKVSGSEYLIMGDQHLLRLKEYEGIKILNPADFLNIYKMGSQNPWRSIP